MNNDSQLLITLYLMRDNRKLFPPFTVLLAIYINRILHRLGSFFRGSAKRSWQTLTRRYKSTSTLVDWSCWKPCWRNTLTKSWSLRKRNRLGRTEQQSTTLFSVADRWLMINSKGLRGLFSPEFVLPSAITIPAIRNNDQKNRREIQFITTQFQSIIGNKNGMSNWFWKAHPGRNEYKTDYNGSSSK